MNFDWKKTIGTVAPLLATALGSPLAGLATKAIVDALGLPGTSTEDQIEAAVRSATPDQLLALRNANNTFQLEMRRLDVNLEDISAKDRQSARELAKTNIWPQAILSTIYTAGYFAMLYMFMAGEVEVPPDLRTEFGMVLGVMTAAQIQIMNFWFGSSAGSKEKDAHK